ncbi:PAS domain S-box-containing protein [Pontibacter aydingkolensis]|uniref:histidine kinase n=1 Tax=Pontibacter aydingkolensis TaxID=1911536 RepID=A0ABS7CQ12_9BACT|nr:PAS domain-containing protein [Pontibacter aydingkolensis]MBW7465936.1 PAS domain-containing protein [Pontibacter aydingkolensis]
MHLVDNKLSSDLTLVFRAMPGLYLLLTSDFDVQDATTAYTKSIDLIPEDIIGKNIFNLFTDNPHDSYDAAKHALNTSLNHVLKYKIAHTIPLVRVDLPQHSRQGFEEKYWKVINTPILDSDGDILYILHEARDITENVRQEQLHQQNEERLAMLTNALHTVAWEYDIKKNVLTWDKQLQQVFGYAPEEMEPSRAAWDKLVHPDDFNAVQQSIAQATSLGQKIWTGEYRLRKADGTYAHVLDQGYFVYDDQNRPSRTFGTIIDLSQNKRAEVELKESDARFRQLLEHLPHMAWTADPKGKVLYFNDNWYSYTGMAKGQTSGWTSVIHPEDTADVLTTWHEAISSGNLYEMEYRIRDCINGSYRSFIERGVPMHDQNGNVTLWVGTFTDIEDQKQSLESIRLKDQQLQNILQLSPAHLCLLEGPNHICRYVSPGVYRMYGSRTYIGKTAREIWPEFEQLGFLDLLDQVYTQGNAAQLSELNVMYDRHQKGEPIEAFFNFRYQPIFNDHGLVEGVLISAVEVTELVKAKHKAEKLAQELEQKIKSAK